MLSRSCVLAVVTPPLRHVRLPPHTGLDKARSLLEPIKAQFPAISYADLWTLAASVAIEEMGGPKIDWVPGM